MISPSVPTLAHLHDAYASVLPAVQVTPLLKSPQLADLSGAADVFVKPESLQRTGSFKIRGAYWRLTQLRAEEARRGVVAFSSGNFAQGLAAAGALLNVPVTIVMPVDAPPAKREAAEDFGARIIISEHGDRGREDVAAETASRIAAEEGLTLLHPFDDPEVVVGQAGVGIEALAQAEQLGISFDEVFCPVGGGGLVAGVSLAFHYLSPKSHLVGVEPKGFAGLAASLAADERVTVPMGGSTVCDGMMARAPGEYPLAAIRAIGGTGSATVGDREVQDAQRFAFEKLKLVLEPSGASGIAALLSQREKVAGKTVLVIATGGNTSLRSLSASHSAEDN